MKYLAVLLLPLCLHSLSAFASCGFDLRGEIWRPNASEKMAFVAKLEENIGEEKRFGHLEDGNNGLHAYLLPIEQIHHIFVVAGNIPGGDNAPLYSFDPAKQALVGVLKTEDESLLSLIVFTKGESKAQMIAYQLNPVDADQVAMKSLVPGSIKEGYYDEFHVLWDILHDGEELHFPARATPMDWSIEAYK